MRSLVLCLLFSLAYAHLKVKGIIFSEEDVTKALDTANKASADTLLYTYGLDEKQVKEIMNRRGFYGEFESMEDISALSGVTPEMVSRIRDKNREECPPLFYPVKDKLNTSEKSELLYSLEIACTGNWCKSGSFDFHKISCPRSSSKCFMSLSFSEKETEKQHYVCSLEGFGAKDTILNENHHFTNVLYDEVDLCIQDIKNGTAVSISEEMFFDERKLSEEEESKMLRSIRSVNQEMDTGYVYSFYFFHCPLLGDECSMGFSASPLDDKHNRAYYECLVTGESKGDVFQDSKPFYTQSVFKNVVKCIEGIQTGITKRSDFVSKKVTGAADRTSFFGLKNFAGVPEEQIKKIFEARPVCSFNNLRSTGVSSQTVQILEKFVEVGCLSTDDCSETMTCVGIPDDLSLPYGKCVPNNPKINSKIGQKCGPLQTKCPAGTLCGYHGECISEWMYEKFQGISSSSNTILFPVYGLSTYLIDVEVQLDPSEITNPEQVYISLDGPNGASAVFWDGRLGLEDHIHLTMSFAFSTHDAVNGAWKLNMKNLKEGEMIKDAKIHIMTTSKEPTF